jgi:hypothetical protein
MKLSNPPYHRFPDGCGYCLHHRAREMAEIGTDEDHTQLGKTVMVICKVLVVHGFSWLPRKDNDSLRFLQFYPIKVYTFDFIYSSFGSTGRYC